MQLQLSRLPSALLPDGSRTPLAPRDAALLAWLALEGPTARLRLAQLLWPDSEPEAARNSLRQRLFQLKKQLGVEPVVGQALLQLAPGVGHDLQHAASVLADADPDVGGEFGAWLSQRRDQALAQARRALLSRIDQAEQAADWPQALAGAGEWLSLEPLSEEAHQRLIRLHYAAGDRAAALRAFERCEQLLRHELGLAPSAATRALHDTVRAAGSAAAPQALRRVPAAVLRPPRMIGRDAEARALEQGWRAGHVVAVTGDAGMGKTRLLQDFAQPRPGVLHVQARPGDAGVPFATLARLWRAMAACQAPPDGASETLGLAVMDPAWPPLPETAVPAIPAAAQRLLMQRDLALRLQGQPAVSGVLLDDLHFADSASLDLLQALLHEPAGPLQWALAWRGADAGRALTDLQDSLAEQARLHAVPLQPLDEAALAQLVDSLDLPGLDGRALAPALRQRTGGNPLFVLETLKLAWMEHGGAAELGGGALLPRPASVARLIERRLAQLSAPAMALARCAAVAGSDFSGALAARVLGTSPLALADAWHELEAAQVLRDEAFVHDLLYEATLASVPAPIARLLHGEIAAQLQDTPGVAPATLARHWLAAGRFERARGPLERAAAAAAQALDVHEAGRLWLQLSQLHEAAGEQPEAFTAAGRAVQAWREHSTGADLAQAIDRLDRLARGPLERADAQRRRAEMHLTRGDTEAAATAVQLALLTLGPDGPAADRSDLLNLQGVLWRRLGRLAEARQSLQAALALARQAAGAAGDLPGVLNNLGLVLQAEDDHLGAIGLMQESAERQPEPATRARVLNNLAISLEERGQVLLAREQRLSAARAVADSGGVVALMLAISLGAVSRNLCHFREAQQHLDRARALGAGQAHFRGEDLLRQQAALWLELGRFNLARQALKEGAVLAGGQTSRSLLDVVRARSLLAQGPGHANEVLALLAPAEAYLLAGGDRRTLRRLWLLKARALPAGEALALLQAQLAEPSVCANPGAALPLTVRLAQVHLALGEHALARRAAERAADWLAAVQPMEITPAEVWLTLAQAAQAQGDTTAACGAVRQGLAFVQHIAAEHLEPMFRDGWQQLNAVNSALAVLAGRLGAAAQGR